MRNEKEFETKDSTLESDERKTDAKVDKTQKGRGKKKSKRNFKGKNKKGNKQTQSASPDNDASWYANNPQILKAAANLSYFTPLGATPSLQAMAEDDGNQQATLTITSHANEIPGVMVFEYVHGPAGDDAFPVEAIDVAANNIYAKIRHANSGGKNYDAPDVMMYLLALDEAYQLFALGQRAYGLMSLYSQTNRYLPQVLVEAAGFNFEDLQGQMANFNAALNVYAAQLSAFCVPADLPYFRRHFWLASTVFMDEDVIKPQLYIHRPALYRIYDDYSSDQGGKLTSYRHKYYTTHSTEQVPVERNLQTQGSLGYTVNEYLDVLNAVITFLNGSSDVGLISGDIMKAYGDNGLFTLTPIPTDYVLIPDKNEEALSQISNFYTVPNFGNLVDDGTNIRRLDITQEVGTETQPPQIVYNPYVGGSMHKIAMLPKILNMHKSDVNPEDTIVSSRWLNTIEAFGTTESGAPIYRFASVGSEFGCGITIYTFTKSSGAIAADSVKTLTFDTYLKSNPLFNAYISKLMEAFDWHPILVIWLVDPDNADNYIIDDVLLDFANYTIVQKNTISNLNQTAILSMFNVPQLGSF